MKISKIISGIFFSFVSLFVFGLLILATGEIFIENKTSGVASVSDSMPVKPELELTASAAISAEVDFENPNKVLFAKGIKKKLPIASLTKLMTAVVVLDNYNLSDRITINELFNSVFPFYKGLEVGDTLSVFDFLHMMIIGSCNKSATALSEKIGEEKFVSLMNQKAKEIGMLDTSFVEPAGLSEKNYSTAEDLVALVKYILSDSKYSKIIDISRQKEFYLEDVGTFENTNQLLAELPDIIGGKTGFTEQAKGCLILIIYNEKSNDYVIDIILGSDDRFLEMKKIINYIN